ncbi:hypothetical protein [Actinophytocola xanthii]|uniref:Uncharacterized protein n=1 Tax=Actinophytocola xanthii TaxID=1912961 RepID=A0A1Q8CST1_9PSEU|nr:hypothetical protein [Actinophytocola xanthii]OLF17421.1 hypothetical protein BU204_11645 [Actinophytocola xanthii]
MSGFLDELGKKAAERWLALLVLPGLLWTATLLAAIHLNHAAPTSVQPLIEAISARTSTPFTTPVIIALLVGFLLSSIGAGIVAAGIGVFIRRVWTLPGRRRPARWLITWRRHRWNIRNQQADQLVLNAITTSAGAHPTGSDKQPVVTASPALAETLALRDAISLEPPSRPTWIGDRWQSTTKRIYRAHGLDLTVAWPRLWTVLPDNLRTDITTTQTAYVTSSTLTSWAFLYLLPALHWWPVVLISLATAATSLVRVRTATNTLCLLIETAADFHTHTLAEKLNPPDPEVGYTINSHLHKQALRAPGTNVNH